MGWLSAYAACDLHALEAVKFFVTGTYVRIDHLTKPHENIRCHCNASATFQLIGWTQL